MCRKLGIFKMMLNFTQFYLQSRMPFRLKDAKYLNPFRILKIKGNEEEPKL